MKMGKSAAASTSSFYQRLRAFLHETPWLYRIARMIRFVAVVGPCRPLLIAYHRNFGRNPTLTTGGMTMVPELDAAEVASTLERAGLAICGVLPEEAVNRVAELLSPIKRGATYNPHEKWDEVKQWAYDPKFLDIARNYFGTEPIVCASKAWWSIPDVKSVEGMTAKGHASTFHFDVADCKSLIVFVYLTDVLGKDCGPHIAIEGTHRKKSLGELAKVYLDDATACRRFSGRIKTVLGKKGTFFFEEQTIYHKGEAPRKPRLILGINYTLHRKPVKTLI